MTSRDFTRRPTADLHGRRIGIVGLGGNGRRLVQLLEPFHCEMNAVDYYPIEKPTSVANLWGPERTVELASISDILILTLPLNASTINSIDKRVFQAMPKDSHFINVARGAVVNEPDLIDALCTGHIAGAGVDVTAVEPLPDTSPLWQLPNVLITPHVGAQATNRVDDTTRLICYNVRRYLDKKPMLNIVDKELGFPRPEVQAVLNHEWRQLFTA